MYLPSGIVAVLSSKWQIVDSKSWISAASIRSRRSIVAVTKFDSLADSDTSIETEVKL